MDRLAASDSPSNHWTRGEVAKHLGVSVSTIRRMEGRALHPAVDEQGVRRFEVAEVRAVYEERVHRPLTKRDSEGETASRVFELLKRGAGPREVVVSAKVHPRVVRELYAEWLVSLRDGEMRRQQAELDAEDRRERARSAREWKALQRALGT